VPHQRRTLSKSEGSTLLLNNTKSGGWNEMYHEKWQYVSVSIHFKLGSREPDQRIQEIYLECYGMHHWKLHNYGQHHKRLINLTRTSHSRVATNTTLQLKRYMLH